MRWICVISAIALTVPSACAQTGVPERVLPGFQTIQQSDLRRDLTYISSDELGGRLSLQPGDELATKWIAGQFAKAGLQPPVKDGSGKPVYLQPLTLIEYRPDRNASTITLTRAGKTTVWRAPDMLGAYKHAVDLSAPVLFAGYGITAPELGYDDYSTIDARGKIVLIFDHEPQEDDPRSIFNGTGNTRYATTRVKVMNAQAHGAVAVVIVAEPNRKHLTNAERHTRIGSSAVRAIPLALQAIQDDEVRIPSAIVLDAVASELMATAGITPGAAQTMIDRDLKPQSRALPDTTLSLHFRNRAERTGVSNNVAGLLPGSDPRLAAETILITAHHDHDGM